MNKKFMALLLCVMMIVTSLATSMAFAETSYKESGDKTTTTKAVKIKKVDDIGKELSIDGVKFNRQGGNYESAKGVVVPEYLLRDKGSKPGDVKTVTAISSTGKSYKIGLTFKNGSTEDSCNAVDVYTATEVTLVENTDPTKKTVTASFYVHINAQVPSAEAGQMPQPSENYYYVTKGKITIPEYNYFEHSEDYQWLQWKTFFKGMDGKEVTNLISEDTLKRIENISMESIFGDKADIPEDSKIVWYVIKDQPSDGTARYHVDGYVIGTEYFHLSYDKNTADTVSGKLPTDQTKYKTGDVATAAEASLTRENYTFMGWSLKSGTENYKETADNSVTFGNRDIKLYAMWAPNEYTVTYKANTGDETEDASIDVPSQATTYYGKDFTLSSEKLNRTGFEFLGWGESPKSTTPISSVKIDGDKTVYAIWKALDAHTLSYDANIPAADNNQLIGDMPASVNPVYDGESALLSTMQPIRNGYVFKGWAASADSKTPIYKVTINGDTVVYAIWAPVYTLTYDGNAGTDTVTDLPASVNGIENGTVQLTTASPKRNHYVFAGWAETQDATKEGIVSSVTITDGNKVVYAVWEPAANFTLRYHANVSDDTTVSSMPTDVTNLYEGDTVTLSATISRNGYDFLGWSIGEATDDATKVATEATIANSDVDVYAVWKEIPKFKVEYDANIADFTGEVPTDSQSYYINTEAPVQEGNLSKLGYDFLGWSKSPSGDLVGETVTTSEGNSTITLYGIWKEKTFKVTYDKNTTDTVEGTIPMDPNEYKLNDDAKVLESDLTRNEYIFKGWSETSDNSTGLVTDKVDIKGNTTLYAVWEQKTYKVIYDANAEGYQGTVPVDGTDYTLNQIVTILDKGDLALNGYTFKGWSQTANNLTGIVDKTLEIKGNTILYAIWSKNETPIIPIDPVTPIPPVTPIDPIIPTDPTLPLPDDEYLPGDEDTNNDGETDNNQQLPDDEMLIEDQEKEENQNEDQPKTGDENRMGMYGILALLATGGILAIRRKRTEE